MVFNYVRTLSNYAWHPQRLSEILECFIVSSVMKDCLAWSQYDLHHDSFLLVTPVVMSGYKSTIIQCKSTFCRWRAVLGKLCSKVKKILKKTLDGIYLEDTSLLCALLLMRQNNKVEQLICLLSRHMSWSSHPESCFPAGVLPKTCLDCWFKTASSVNEGKSFLCNDWVLCNGYVWQFPISPFCKSRCRVLLQGKLQNRRLHCMERARLVTQTVDSTSIIYIILYI